MVLFDALLWLTVICGSEHLTSWTKLMDPTAAGLAACHVLTSADCSARSIMQQVLCSCEACVHVANQQAQVLRIWSCTTFVCLHDLQEGGA